MSSEIVDTLVVGGGQAGLAMSAHLRKRGLSHVVVERHRIAERWRSERWDSLVANGPAWHDRFPDLAFADLDADDFAPRDRIVAYFEAFAAQIAAPVRCGVQVTSVTTRPGGGGFDVETSSGAIVAKQVVCATGPFQRPVLPKLIAATETIVQVHSSAYRNPEQLPPGAVLVVGAGASGSQIAEELNEAGRHVFLALGPHDRPPRRYRGRDFCWWLGVLGMWDAVARDPGTEHVTIAVSGAMGGHTVDFRQLAAKGIVLLGRADSHEAGIVRFRADLRHNIAAGDANYLAVLDKADAYAVTHGLDLPEEPTARLFAPDPDCLTNPILALDLAAAGIRAVVWATGYGLNFEWLKVDAFDDRQRPMHHRGVAEVPGLYFLGLPWLSSRASAFIWGAWRDADYIAGHIAARLDGQTPPAA